VQRGGEVEDACECNMVGRERLLLTISIPHSQCFPTMLAVKKSGALSMAGRCTDRYAFVAV
jgi:hypothetical protein